MCSSEKPPSLGAREQHWIGAVCQTNHRKRSGVVTKAMRRPDGERAAACRRRLGSVRLTLLLLGRQRTGQRSVARVARSRSARAG